MIIDTCLCILIYIYMSKTLTSLKAKFAWLSSWHSTWSKIKYDFISGQGKFLQNNSYFEKFIEYELKW